MAASRAEDRSVHISGTATSNVIQTGDGGTVTVGVAGDVMNDVVEVRNRLALLRSALGSVAGSRRPEIEEEFRTIDAELSVPTPSKRKIAESLTRALTYAKTAKDFADAVAGLREHASHVAHWLGDAGQSILSVLGSYRP